MITSQIKYFLVVLCSYGPYISYIIKKVTQRAYPNGTQHHPLQPKPSKTVRVPSPQDDQQEEQEIFEEREVPHSWEAYQPGGGSTAPRGGLTASGRRRRSTVLLFTN
jgi:hypothetical protein